MGAEEYHGRLPDCFTQNVLCRPADEFEIVWIPTYLILFFHLDLVRIISQSLLSLFSFSSGGIDLDFPIFCHAFLSCTAPGLKICDILGAAYLGCFYLRKIDYEILLNHSPYHRLAKLSVLLEEHSATTRNVRANKEISHVCLLIRGMRV